MAEFRVLVADDSAVVRAGVRALLDLEPAIEVVDAIGSLHELRHAVEENFVESGGSDIVITDIRMPPTSTDEGIVAAEQLRTTHPWVGVIVLSQFADPAYLARLIREGASGRGYLLKDHIAEPSELITAIELVGRGGSFVDRQVADLLIDRRVQRSTLPLTVLTPRELDVLAGVATGRSNVAIGEMLFISHRAVEKHISSIFTKLDLFDDPDANRRVRAVLAYLDAGLEPGARSG